MSMVRRRPIVRRGGQPEGLGKRVRKAGATAGRKALSGVGCAGKWTLERVVQGSKNAAVHYRNHQHLYDPAALAASASVVAGSVAQDYTGLSLPSSMAIAGVGVAAGESLHRLDSYLEQHNVPKGVRAGAFLGAAAIENYCLTALATGNAALDNPDQIEMGFLQLLAYGAYRGAAPAVSWAYDKLKPTQVLQRGRAMAKAAGKVVKRTATAATLAAMTLAGAAATNSVDTLNLPQYDIVTGFSKEGMPDPDEQRLGLPIRRDVRGRYAVTTLAQEKGKALYGAVVLRYTDFTEHEDVMRAAEKIASRSGIDDVTAIRPGQELRIPVELLAERFREGYVPPAQVVPAQVPDTAVANRPRHGAPAADPGTALRPLQSDGLSGKYFILDAGHGGRDPGASANKAVENEIAYDTMVRLAEELRQRGGTVYPIVADRTTGYDPQKTLADNRDEDVLVTPPYRPGNGNIAANFRAYKVHDVRNSLLAQGVLEEDIMLVSVHADALHPSAEGMMIYYPDADLRKTVRLKGPVYELREEFQRNPKIRFSGDAQLAESLSYTLAQRIVEAAPGNDVAVHANQPVRGGIVRNKGRRWIPAVLQGGGVGILVEVGNVANKGDAYRMRQSSYRQQLAETMADGISSYYGGSL